MSGRQFTGDEGHYHQDAINADAAAREQAARIAAAQAAAEGAHYHQAAINQEASAEQGVSMERAEVTFGALSERAQTYLATRRANTRSGPGPFNNWTVLGDDALQALRDGGFEAEVNTLLGIEESVAEQEAPATAETDPAIAEFYERLNSVRSFDELYGVLSRKNYVFDTPSGDETWTGEDMIALIRTVESGEQSLSAIPDVWDEIKRAVERLLQAQQAPVAETETEPEPTPEDVQEVPAPPATPEITLEEVDEPEPAPDPVPPTPVPPTPEQVVTLEQLFGNLTAAREAYIREHRAYLDEQRAGGFLQRLKTKFGGVKPEAEAALPESLRFAKDAYDDAMRAYGIGLSESDLAEVPQAERTEDQELAARARAFQDVFCAEYTLTKRAQAETYPPAEKNLFVKGVEWWSKRSLLTKIGVTSGLVLFGGTVGAGIAAGLSGASFAAMAGGIFEKVSKVAKLDQMRDRNLATIWNHLTETQPDTAEAFSLAESQARRVMSEDEARRRMREIKRTAVMLAAGLLGVGAAAGIRELLSGASSAAPEGSPPVEAGSGTEGTSEGVTKALGGTEGADGAATDVTGSGTEAGSTAAPTPTVETPVDSGLRAEPIPVAEVIATPEQAGWFEMLHHTPYDASSPLDQAKMTVIQKLSEAGIMGSNNGASVPSPLVDRVIQSVFGGAENVQGWQAAANAVSDPNVLAQIKTAQAAAFANPAQNAVAEATIRALFTK